jgi:hypothetical protein
MARTKVAFPRRLVRLRERIDQWRSTRTKLWPMPAELWSEAAALARELGVGTVQQALKIGYTSLKRRVVERPLARGCAGAGDGEFVELSGAQLFGMGMGPVVELADRSGARLVVRLPAGSTLDVEGLVEAFRGGRG